MSSIKKNLGVICSQMATPEKINQLSGVLANFKSINWEMFLRKDLGVESMIDSERKFKDVIEKVEFALDHAKGVSDAVLSSATSIFQQLLNLINAHSVRNNSEYVAQKNTFLNQFSLLNEQLLGYWPFFISAAVEKQGLLVGGKKLKQEYVRAAEEMEAKAKFTLSEVQTKADEIIRQTKEFAKTIEEKARQTATQISVEDAQKQFEDAEEYFNKKVKNWNLLSGISIALFIFLALTFEVSAPSKGEINFVIYFAAIRITVLTAVGAAATFCLKILRAQMHMREQNMHRKRIANSIASFVESARTPEQQDLILIHLVDTIVAFGNSGLLIDGDDSVAPSKLTIDSITRTIGLPSNGK